MLDVLYSEKHLRDAYPTPTEAKVASLEKKIGAVLPDSYRRFVLERSGGFFKGVVLPFPNGKGDFLVNLYGIDTGTKHAELGGNLDLFDDNFPAKMLPIGGTGMGGLVLIYVGGPPEQKGGSIWLKLSFSPEFVELAPTIDDFFALLRFEEE